MTTPQQPNPAPGWYADPGNPALLRWWDGNAWTDNTSPVPQQAAAPAPYQATMQGPAAATSESMALHWALPIGRSGLAIAAGYLAFFAVLLVFAPIALVVGLLALRDISKHPEKKGKGRAWFGVIMGALGTLAILAIIFLGG